MAALLYIVILLALTGHSSATYCVCKDGVGDATLQKALELTAVQSTKAVRVTNPTLSKITSPLVAWRDGFLGL
ncbi:hypothetical protein ACFXTH_035823 [Malus domestica]